MKKPIHEIHRRSLWQVPGIYLARAATERARRLVDGS